MFKLASSKLMQRNKTLTQCSIKKKNRCLAAACDISHLLKSTHLAIYVELNY